MFTCDAGFVLQGEARAAGEGGREKGSVYYALNKADKHKRWLGISYSTKNPRETGKWLHACHRVCI